MLRVGRPRSSFPAAPRHGGPALTLAESAVAAPHSSLPAAALVRGRGAECVCPLGVQGRELLNWNGMGTGGCSVGRAGPRLQNKQMRVGGPRIDFFFCHLPERC